MTDELLPKIITCVCRETAQNVQGALNARFGIETTIQPKFRKNVDLLLLSMGEVHNLKAFQNFADGYLGGYVDGLAEGIATMS